MNDEILELEKLRRAQGLTQKQIAERLGCTEKSLNNWLRNGVSPSPPYTQKIGNLIQDLRAVADGEDSAGKFKERILDTLSHTYFDRPLSRSPQEERCVLWRILRLSELREIFQNDPDVYTDHKIIASLESLARSGKVKVFGIQAVDADDFKFSCEIGSGEYDWRRVRVEKTRFYKDKPLTKDELLAREVTLNVSAICEIQEKQRQAHFRERFGKPQTMDGTYARESYEDDIADRKKQDRLLTAVESLAGKGEKQ